MRTFVEWYNTQHLHSGIRYVTPEERHNGKEKVEKRHEVYEEAKKKHPKRWSGKTRNWERIEAVYLNPVKTEEKEIP